MTTALLALLACGTSAPEAHDDPADAHAKTEDHGKSADHDKSDAKTDGHDHHDAHSSMPSQPAVPAGAAVKFVAPTAGAKSTSPVHVVMGVEGMKVMKAGEVVEGTGHHHIIIDGSPVPAGTVVPADDTHIHFGGGQTEVDLELQPGEHRLTLQFADGLHRSYGDQMSTSIDVTVE